MSVPFKLNEVGVTLIHVMRDVTDVYAGTAFSHAHIIAHVDAGPLGTMTLDLLAADFVPSKPESELNDDDQAHGESFDASLEAEVSRRLDLGATEANVVKIDGIGFNYLVTATL